MGKHALDQSAASRALEDTLKFFHRIVFFLVIEVGAMGIGGFFGTLLTPDSPSKFEAAFYPTIGVIVGLVIGLFIIYLVMFIKAPYVQRNEVRASLLAKPKPMPLQNRAKLIEAIIKTRQAATELIGWKEQFHKSQLASPNVIQTKLVAKVNGYDDQLTLTLKELEVQGNVASNVFTSIVSGFSKFIQSEMLPKGSQCFDALKVSNDILEREKEVIRQIDLLSGNTSSSVQ